MFRFIPHTLRIRWAGPAVVLALCYTAALAGPLPAAAAPPPASPPAAARAAVTSIGCITEGYNFGAALVEWYAAYDNYNWTVPGGTPEEILRAAEQLDAATVKVVDTGTKLLLCLVKALE